MANVLGGDHRATSYGGYLHCLAHDPGLHIHNYGKTSCPAARSGTSP